MRITAAVVREAGDHLSLETLELDEPRADEVRVRIVATGICHTDHTVMHGHFSPPIALPMVLGHEGAGIVEAVGPAVTTLRPGDHVVLSIEGCGTCAPCRTGQTPYCDHAAAANFGRTRLDGSATLNDARGPVGASFFGQSSFATYALARTTNAVKVPSDLPLDLLAPLGCGLQTGAGAVFNVIRSQPGESIVVFGVGTVGLAAIMAARVSGCDPIVAVDTKPSRLEMARELGATHLIDASLGDLGQQLRAIMPEGFDSAVDTSAVPAVFAAGVDALRRAGTIVLLGAAAHGTQVTLDMNSILVGKQIRGSIQGDARPHEFIPRLVDLHRNGQFPFDRFVTFYPFAEIEQAMRDAADGKAVKAVLRMNDQ